MAHPRAQDRHGRRRRTPVDPLRRPSDGYRALDAHRFDRLVGDALDDLPESLRRQIDNVHVTVEDVPPAGPDGDELLLGLYEGVPRTEREHGMAMLPDRITLFRRPIELRAGSRRELESIVRETVIHEVAHHFGIDDDRLDDLGWA